MSSLEERGSRAYERGDYVVARKLLVAAVSADPTSSAAHFCLGQTLKTGLLDTPRIMRARDHFAAAARLRPEWPAAWYELALTSSWVSDLETTLTAVRRTLALDETHWAAWHLLYGCLAERGEYVAALAALQRAATLNPASAEIAYELERVRTAEVRGALEPVRFPLQVRAFDDLSRAIDQFIVPAAGAAAPFLSRNSVLLTLGSCFARRIAHSLQNLGLSAVHVEQLEDVNTTYANRSFMEWLLGLGVDRAGTFDRVFGEPYRAAVEDVLRRADAVVYSLGVAPCFFDRASGEPVLTIGMNPLFALRAGHLEFRMTSVGENVENLERIAALIRRANPHATFVLTVSPVPLRATIGSPSAVVSDCVSKSTLRVAAATFMQNAPPRSLYWPSFEAVRWIGAYTGPAYGADDGSAFHVNESTVDAINRAFIRRFGDRELAQLADTGTR